MSRGFKKRRKELRATIATIPGFKLLSLEQTGGDHYCCTVRDDAGNVFKAFTSSTVNGNDKRARLNFKSHIKRQSNVEKGILE